MAEIGDNGRKMQCWSYGRILWAEKTYGLSSTHGFDASTQ